MKKYWILFCIFSIPFSCNLENKFDDNSTTPNVVIIFNKTPPQYSTDALILKGKILFPKNQIISYIDTTKNISYFKPSSLNKDTLIVPTFKGTAEVSHLYQVYEKIPYLFAAGDTVLFEYDSNNRPIAKSLTSDKLTQLYNLPFTIPGFFNKNYSLEVMLSAIDVQRTYYNYKIKGANALNGMSNELIEKVNRNYINLDSVEILYGNYLNNFETKLEEINLTNAIPIAWYHYYSDLIKLKRVKTLYYQEERTESIGKSDIYKDTDYAALFSDDNLMRISFHEEFNKYYLPRLYNVKEDDSFYSIVFDSISRDKNLSKTAKKIALSHYLDGIKIRSNNLMDNVRINRYIEITGDSSVLKDPEIKKIMTENPKDDINLISYSGEELKLPQLLESYRGKIIYVDFWASWCQPCIKGMPNAKKLREEYKDKDVVFLYLAHNDEMGRWKSAVKKHELDYLGHNYFMTNSRRSEFIKQIKLTGIPYFIIYDKKGKLAVVNAPRPDSAEIKLLLNKYINE